ncbi:hypothetical protein [Absidia glauca]|uniref:Uncharacterized protein n=1 Tax=Absidia glauca TaxID=4829 RepID=A0A163J8X3_ABSGL|nr:hypothetical protein [Absidia glauca]
MKFTFVIAALFVVSAIAAPCGKKHVGDDVAPPSTDDVATDLPPSVDSHDDNHQDEIKTVIKNKQVEKNDQTAVINQNSPQDGGHGSLIGVNAANNLLAGGILSSSKNEVNQSNH